MEKLPNFEIIKESNIVKVFIKNKIYEIEKTEWETEENNVTGWGLFVLLIIALSYFSYKPQDLTFFKFSFIPDNMFKIFMTTFESSKVQIIRILAFSFFAFSILYNFGEKILYSVITVSFIVTIIIFWIITSVNPNLSAFSVLTPVILGLVSVMMVSCTNLFQLVFSLFILVGMAIFLLEGSIYLKAVNLAGVITGIFMFMLFFDRELRIYFWNNLKILGFTIVVIILSIVFLNYNNCYSGKCMFWVIGSTVLIIALILQQFYENSILAMEGNKILQIIARLSVRKAILKIHYQKLPQDAHLPPENTKSL